MSSWKVLPVLLALLFFGSAFGAYQVFDVNVLEPTTGTSYSPKINGSDMCIDFNVAVFDTNAGAAIHYANIYYDFGDSNTFIARDLNLSSSNCHFHGTSNVWATGADCDIHYCWSTDNPYTGTYSIDFNIANKTNEGVRDYNFNKVITLTVNSSYIDSSTSAMIQIIPVVLIAAIIVVAVLGIGGVVPGTFVIVLLPALIITLVVVTAIFGGLFNILTGKP